MVAVRDHIFRWLARVYPTERMDRSPILSAAWRTLFYTVRPRSPFEMRTRHYRLIVHPRKGTLTRALIRRGFWEKAQTEAFLAHLSPGGIVVDAGANFGHYALVAANRVGPTGRVFAFEPHPPTFQLLQENASLLDDPTLTAENAAIGREAGVMTLYVDQANAGGHSLVRSSVKREAAAVQVPVHTLDGYLARSELNNPVTLIKIDVQGYELAVLSGARETLARDRPVVFCEITPADVRAAGDEPVEIIGLFDDLDYRMRLLNFDEQRYRDIAFNDAAKLVADQTIGYHDWIFEPV